MTGYTLVAFSAAALTIAACASGADVAVPATSMSPLSEQLPDATASITVSTDSSPAATAASNVAPTVSSNGVEVEGAELAGVEPRGFTTALIEITKSDGTVCVVCMWLADTVGERAQGLMGVTSLGTPEGMAFVWDEPTAGSFFMFQTVTPLSIAWFADPGASAGGSLVSTTDMEPCVSENSAECERFPAGGEFVLAIEVFQGDLASIGITDGATARLLADTEAADCPLA